MGRSGLCSSQGSRGNLSSSFLEDVVTPGSTWGGHGPRTECLAEGGPAAEEFWRVLRVGGGGDGTQGSSLLSP